MYEFACIYKRFLYCLKAYCVCLSIKFKKKMRVGIVLELYFRVQVMGR